MITTSPTALSTGATTPWRGRHNNLLPPDRDKTRDVSTGNEERGYYITLKPPVGLWHHLDSVSPIIRFFIVLVGMGGGI